MLSTLTIIPQRRKLPFGEQFAKSRLKSKHFFRAKLMVEGSLA